MKTCEDKGNWPKEGEWVHKAPKKEVSFDFECTEETLIKEKKISIGASTSRSQDKQSKEMDPPCLVHFWRPVRRCYEIARS